MSDRTVAERRWVQRPYDPSSAQGLARALNLPLEVAALLASRGFDEREPAQEHLDASPHTLHDPALLPGMEAATERLARALDAGETILIHGDYDVDGVTGTALLVRLLEMLGGQVVWHIPNRLVDGYSFGAHSVARAEETGASVVVSVDNGTSAFETIAELRERGIDTVVTDHHEPPPPHPEHGELPAATAIVNPKLAGSTYPWRELCGGAVAFKLAWGLCQRVSGTQRVRPELKRFLEDAMSYVAIATVSDVVPLRDENRVFARWGLRALEGTEHAGLRALLEVCGITGRTLTGEDVGFQIGPRINASGRLGSAQCAVDCLLATDPDAARRAAQELDRLNVERKQIESDVLVEARAQAADLAADEANAVLVVAGQGWHQGVVGIVAARLVDEFHRPAVVIGLDGETGRGSARSVAGFSVLEAMHGAADVVDRYGGHAQAAGLEIRADAVEAARAAICTRAREILASGELREPAIDVDLELPFERMGEDLMRQLDRLAPFGAENEKPVFYSRDVRLACPPRIVGRDGTHLMLQIRRGTNERKAMAFGRAHRAHELEMGAPLHVLYTPRWNTFRGQTNLELELVDFRVGAAPTLAVGE